MFFKIKYLVDLIPILLIYLILEILKRIESNQKALLLSSILLVILFLTYRFFKNDSIIISRLNHTLTESRRNFIIFIIFISTLTIISQNYFLNFEMIDWDIPSYLVAASDVLRGNLPLENQWESKGPVFFYLYSLILIISGKNIIFFKLLNDLILLFLSLIIFKIVSLKTNKNFVLSSLASTLFILLFSLSSLVSEYSELYSLVFISLSYYFYEKNKDNNSNLILIGIFMSLSTLINQGTVLFVLPYLIIIFLANKGKNVFKKYTFFGLGLIGPHLFFLLIYFINNLTDIYIATFIEIPFKYTASTFSYIYELRVFFRQYFELNNFIYISIFVLIIFYLFNLIDEKNLSKVYRDFDVLNIFFGLAFYIIASHNYYHHLFFVLFFIPFFVSKIRYQKQISLLLLVILTSSLSIINDRFSKSYEYLSDIENTINNYPIYQMSIDLNDRMSNNQYKIFALDYVLVLFYLDKPNYTYVIHPSNFEEDFIVETLDRLEYQRKNIEDDIVLGNFVDIIICTPRMVINGEVRSNPLINCDVSAYNRNYLRVDTTQYNINPNLEYVNDPYKEISLYIKTKTN